MAYRLCKITECRIGNYSSSVTSSLHLIVNLKVEANLFYVMLTINNVITIYFFYLIDFIYFFSLLFSLRKIQRCQLARRLH